MKFPRATRQVRRYAVMAGRRRRRHSGSGLPDTDFLGLRCQDCERSHTLLPFRSHV